MFNVILHITITLNQSRHCYSQITKKKHLCHFTNIASSVWYYSFSKADLVEQFLHSVNVSVLKLEADNNLGTFKYM